MTKRNTTAYWLLLIGILLLVSGLLLIRPTRSHYINTTVWNTAIYPATTPTSNCLVVGGKQTILLGELELTEEGTSYPFTLSEVGDGLTCSVDAEAAEYLTAAVDTTVDEDGKVTGTLTLTPDLDTAHGAVEAQITVTWTVGETVLSGVFHVTIPEVVIATTPEGDSSGGDNSGGSENNPSGTTTDPNAGTSDDGTQQQTEDTTQDSPTVTPTVGAVNLTVKAPETYDPSGSLPVYLKVEGAFNAIYLGTPVKDENGNDIMGALPSMTRYSLDGGETYTLLYNGGLIELNADSELPLAEGGTVLLDLTLTESQTFYVQVYNSELVHAETFDAEAGNLLPREETGGARVVTAAKNSGIKVDLPTQWSEAELTWKVSARDGYGTYTDIEKPADIGLTVELVNDEDKGSRYIQITTQNENGLTPAPGTYKLQLDWSWEGTRFAGTELTFFVNYVVDAQA